MGVVATLFTLVVDAHAIALVVGHTLKALAHRRVTVGLTAAALVVGRACGNTLEVGVAGLAARAVGILHALLAVSRDAEGVRRAAMVVREALFAAKAHGITETEPAVVVGGAFGAELKGGVAEFIHRAGHSVGTTRLALAARTTDRVGGTAVVVRKALATAVARRVAEGFSRAALGVAVAFRTPAGICADFASVTLIGARALDAGAAAA